MISDPRRQFLRKLTFALGTVSLTGCGGGTRDAPAGVGAPSAGALVVPPATTDASLVAQSATLLSSSPAAPPPPPVLQLPPPGTLARTPAWLNGVPLNRWVEIPGTVLAGSPGAPGENPADIYAISNRTIHAYSGMAFRDDTSEVWVAANGGHSDASDNAVRSIAIADDLPAWRLRCAPSALADRLVDVPYYADGKPTSRHTYWSTHWSSIRGRVMLHRTRFAYGSAVSFNASNGFDPVTNTWDPARTWSDGQTAQCRDASDNVWAMNGTSLYKWTSSADTWVLTANFNGAAFPNGPMAYDAARGQLVTVAWGDGQGYGADALNAWIISSDGRSRQAITFNSSAAYNQFVADKPAYAALEYDLDNQQLLFYVAAASATTRVYVVTPNSGTVWDMSLLALDGASVVPVDAGGSLMNKFRYVPALRGFVLFTSAVNNLYFLRTA